MLADERDIVAGALKRSTLFLEDAHIESNVRGGHVRHFDARLSGGPLNG